MSPKSSLSTLGSARQIPFSLWVPSLQLPSAFQLKCRCLARTHSPPSFFGLFSYSEPKRFSCSSRSPGAFAQQAPAPEVLTWRVRSGARNPRRYHAALPPPPPTPLQPGVRGSGPRPQVRRLPSPGTRQYSRAVLTEPCAFSPCWLCCSCSLKHSPPAPSPPVEIFLML